MTGVGLRAGALLVVVALGTTACGANGSEPETGPLPVITPAEPWNSLPLAEVSGPLSMRDGCLLVGDELVFWPHGTRWDDEREALVFEDAEPLHLGDDVDGGGGFYDVRGDDSGPLDLDSWLGRDAGRALRNCSSATGLTGLVFAYPATSAG